MCQCLLSLLCLLCAAIGIVNAEISINPYVEALKIRPWKSVQKYVEVRPGAFMFYWLYYADGVSENAESKPLIIWIQGGPGLAASGIANFAELGPLDMEMRPRNHTWVHGRNVLLIDHPVGTGFSYVKDPSLMVTTDREMATDLLRMIRIFYRNHKKFRKTPTYIIGQSYGGKITPRLAFYLNLAIQNKKLKMNLKGIGIGGGWVDPKESSTAQPEMLYNMGVLDKKAYHKSLAMVHTIRRYVDTKNYELANEWDTKFFEYLYIISGMDLNFNNINQASPYPALMKLVTKVNKYVKPTLSRIVNQSLEWNYISDVAFNKLKKNFLVPSTKFVELLLNQTTLKVAVYNGNLDVVTPIAGASNWVHKLKWPAAREFYEAKKQPIAGNRNGFYKITKQLSFWWVFGSGHWIPEDNPTAMHQILDYLINSNIHLQFFDTI